MKKKFLRIFILLTLCLSGVMITKPVSEEKPLDPPKNILVLCSHAESWHTMVITVVDLHNNELVLLKYSFSVAYGKDHLEDMIRTGMKVDIRLQKQISAKCNGKSED